jgi:hypothetical protein
MPCLPVLLLCSLLTRICLSSLIPFGKSDPNLYDIATRVRQINKLSSYKIKDSRVLKGNKHIDRRLNEIYLDPTGRGFYMMKIGHYLKVCFQSTEKLFSTQAG